jgi:hypothetical protein
VKFFVLEEFIMVTEPDTFDPTTDEIEALRRLEQEAVQIDTGLHAAPSHRLVDLGFVTTNAAGVPALTARGLALVRHR